MKRLLVTMYRLYFYERIVLWLVVAAILFFASSLVVSVPAAWAVRYAALILASGLPLLAVASQLGSIMPTRHLAMIPYMKYFLLAATACLLMLLSGFLVLGHALLPFRTAPDFLSVFLAIFCAGSVVTVFVCGLKSGRVFFTLILALIFFNKPIATASGYLSNMEAPASYGLLLVTSLSCWVWLALRPPRMDGIKFQFSMRRHSPPSFEALTGKIDVSELSGIKTLFYGSPSREQGRVWTIVLQFLTYVLATAVIAYVLIPIGPGSWGDYLMTVPYFVLLGVPVNIAKWTRNMRTLWLKVSGDRPQFWQLWHGFFSTDLLLWGTILSIYGVILQLVFDAPWISMFRYAVIVFILLPSLCYTAAWFQLLGAVKNRLALWLAVIYLSLLVVLVIASYAMKTYPPVVVLGILSSGVGLLAYFQLKRKFSTLDWQQMRFNSWLTV